MRSVSIAELRQNPTSALDAAESGETVVITRYRKPIAEIRPPAQRLRGRGPSGREVMEAVKRWPKMSDNSWAEDMKRLRELDELDSNRIADAMKAAGW